MVSRRSITPVFCAACGAAFGFYFLSRIYHNGILSLTNFYLLLLIPLVVFSCFRVIASYPLCQNIHAAKIAARYSLAWVLGLAIGIGAGGNALTRCDWGLAPEKITGISGVLTEDPRIVSRGRIIAVLKLKEVCADNGLRAGARGEIAVLFPQAAAERLKEFGRRSSIFCSGAVFTGDAGSLFIADSLHVIRPAPPGESFRTQVCNSLVRRFTSCGDAWGALALALLVGIRDNLDSEFTGLFRDAGCTYLLALSGMHLAIIASLLAFFLTKPLGLKPAAICGSVIVIAYCLLVGPLPSLYRSALMYLLGVLAIMCSLRREALSVLSMAFIIQIIATPAAGNTISFILSYLALIGILSIGEAVNFLFKGKIPPIISGSLSASIGAFLLTAGVCSYYFSVLRPVGIIAGLVLVPLITVFMVGAIAWILLGLILPGLSGILNPVLSLVYDLIEKTVSLAAHAPYFKAGGFWPVLTVSLVLSVFILWYAGKRQAERNRFPAFN